MTGAGIKILLVDDEKHFADTLTARLEMRGFEVQVAYSGPEALTALAFGPEVVVLDLSMPGMDGLEVLHALKKSNPAIQVIMLTGHADALEERTAYQAGVHCVLSKPLNMQELLESIRIAHQAKEN